MQAFPNPSCLASRCRTAHVYTSLAHRAADVEVEVRASTLTQTSFTPQNSIPVRALRGAPPDRTAPRVPCTTRTASRTPTAIGCERNIHAEEQKAAGSTAIAGVPNAHIYATWPRHREEADRPRRTWATEDKLSFTGETLDNLSPEVSPRLAKASREARDEPHSSSPYCSTASTSGVGVEVFFIRDVIASLSRTRAIAPNAKSQVCKQPYTVE